MRRRRGVIRWLFVMTVVVPAIAALIPAAVVNADDAAFDDVWATTDQAVKDGQASYGWFWGPENLLQTVEVYVTDHGDEREVRYYDKSRMEINNPSGDRNSIYYVTNGLLASELITGRLQYSDGGFEQRAPATALVAGDPVNNDGTPSYKTFGDAHLATTDGASNRSVDKSGQGVTEFLSGNGVISSTDWGGVSYTQYQSVTGHNFANVFWDWAQSGNSGLRPEVGVDWLYVLGYPITEPYWIDSTVGGTVHSVLVQIFERRALTYTPSNPEQYRIEFGNIGQHYYKWRYGLGSGSTVPAHYDVIFTTTIGFDIDIARVEYDGSGYHNLTDGHAGYDGWPTYAPNGDYIAYKRGGNVDLGALAIMNQDGGFIGELDQNVGAIWDWSYDSNYISYEQGGQAWIIHRSNGQNRIKIGDGNIRVAWSPNSVELLGTDGHSVNRYAPLSGSDAQLIGTADTGTTIQALAWIKGNRFVALLNTSSVHCIQVFSVGTSPITLTATCSNTTPLRGLRISADQTECAYVAIFDNHDTLRVQKLTGSARAHDLDLHVDGTGDLRIIGYDWSHHPTDIVVGASRGNSSAIYVISHDSASQHRLTDPSLVAGRDPSISPGR